MSFRCHTSFGEGKDDMGADITKQQAAASRSKQQRATDDSAQQLIVTRNRQQEVGADSNTQERTTSYSRRQCTTAKTTVCYSGQKRPINNDAQQLKNEFIYLAP